jgi:hypothetical protein
MADSARSRQPEVLHPFSTSRDRVPMATQIKTTLLVSSQQSLRLRGAFGRYLTLVKDPSSVLHRRHCPSRVRSKASPALPKKNDSRLINGLPGCLRRFSAWL